MEGHSTDNNDTGYLVYSNHFAVKKNNVETIVVVIEAVLISAAPGRLVHSYGFGSRIKRQDSALKFWNAALLISSSFCYFGVNNTNNAE